MRAVILNMPNLLRLRELSRLTAEKLHQTTWVRIDPFDHLHDQFEEVAEQLGEDVASGLMDAVEATSKAMDEKKSIILDWRLTAENLVSFVREVCRTDLSIDVVTITPASNAVQHRGGVELGARDRLALNRFFRAKMEQTPATAMIDSCRKRPAQIADEVIRVLRLRSNE